MKSIGLTIVFHHEGAFAIPALASMADLARRTSTAGIRLETRALLDRPDFDTRRIVVKAGAWLDDIVEVDFGDLGSARNEGVRLSACDYQAFLDGDDLWGADWLCRASTESESAGWPDDVVWHPEWLHYFDERDFAVHGNGTLPDHRARSFLMRHTSSDAAVFEPRNLLMNNLWTANVFAPRALHERFPYTVANRAPGFGVEDWSWNIETVAMGIHHAVVPDTVHMIRVKEVGSLGQQNTREGLLPYMPEQRTAWFTASLLAPRERPADEPADKRDLPIRRVA